MAKITVAGPSFTPDTERPETLGEQTTRQQDDIDRANLAGLPYQRIIGEGEPATVVEFGEVDSDGQPKDRIYKRRGENSVGPTNTLKGR
jgi:hypothetical protein